MPNEMTFLEVVQGIHAFTKAFLTVPRDSRDTTLTGDTFVKRVWQPISPRITVRPSFKVGENSHIRVSSHEAIVSTGRKKTFDFVLPEHWTECPPKLIFAHMATEGPWSTTP